MTTNDATYYARRGRLRDASEGATVTIPDGWEPPADAEPKERQLVPGDRFTNDGNDDGIPWRLDDAARARIGFGSLWWDSETLARLGLVVDPADDDQDDTTTATGEDQTAIIAALEALPTGSTLTFDEPRDFAPGAYRMGIPPNYRIAGLLHEEGGGWEVRGVRVTGGDCKFWLPSSHLPALGVTAEDFATSDAPEVDDPDDSTGDTPPATTGCDCEHCEAVRNGDEDDRSRGTTFGTVSVKVVPDTSDLEVTGDESPRLDEYQRERVAALHEALMILEVRRSPETTDKARSFGDVFAPTGRPMVKPTDLINVAAFIADGTIPGGGQA